MMLRLSALFVIYLSRRADMYPDFVGLVPNLSEIPL